MSEPIAVAFIPIRANLGQNARLHFMERARRTKAERRTAWAVTQKWVLPPGGARVHLVRFGAKPVDTDNLTGVLKATRDGIADRLGIDDGGPEVTWTYAQEPCKPGQFGVRAELWERPA